MADYATVADVEALWRPLDGAEQVRAGVLLTRASALIRLRVPSLDDRASLDLDLAEVTRGVVIEMVLRALRNPDGKISETIGDYSYRRPDASTGGMYVTPDELALLAGAAPVGGVLVSLPLTTWGA